MYVYFFWGVVFFSSENYFVCPPAMDNLHSVRLYLPPYTSKEELQAGAFFRVNKRNWGVPFVQGLGEKMGSLTKEYQWWGRLDRFCQKVSRKKHATLEQAGLYKLWSVDSWYNKLQQDFSIHQNPPCLYSAKSNSKLVQSRFHLRWTGFGKNPSRGCWKYLEILLLLLNIYLILLDPTYHKIQDLEIIPSP